MYTYTYIQKHTQILTHTRAHTKKTTTTYVYTNKHTQTPISMQTHAHQPITQTIPLPVPKQTNTNTHAQIYTSYTYCISMNKPLYINSTQMPLRFHFQRLLSVPPHIDEFRSHLFSPRHNSYANVSSFLWFIDTLEMVITEAMKYGENGEIS